MDADDRVARKAALKKQIEDSGCRGCQFDEANRRGVSIMQYDVACICPTCGWRDGPEHMHICKTGAWEAVCSTCNAKLPDKA